MAAGRAPAEPARGAVAAGLRLRRPAARGASAVERGDDAVGAARSAGVAAVALGRALTIRRGVRREEEQEAAVLLGPDLVALVRRPVGDVAGPSALRAALVLDLELAVDDDQVRVLVDLVLLQQIPARR